MNIFEKIADKLKETENEAYCKNETSFELFEISHCTDTSIIGREYPQVDFIDLEKAHSINYHNKPNIFEFNKITLHKTSKLTDIVSTAAISAHGFMLSKKALDIFTSKNIGKHSIYPANLIHKGASYKYFYLLFDNDITNEIDFKQSTFFIANLLGKPQMDININSPKEFESTRNKIKKGEFKNIKKSYYLRVKNCVFKNSINNISFFTLRPLGVTQFINKELKDKLESNNITGLSIKSTQKLKLHTTQV